ncbi:MAG: hypothetical protein PHU70_06850 [Dehalococcoidia bacterium]|nr:hypothetical protein [Dehalococcoidia bacterium]
MLFSLLLYIMSISIAMTAKTNRSIRELISIRNSTYVIKTRDGKRGRRYVFRKGKYSSDKMLNEFDLALVFENADVGFKTLALGGDTGLQTAINNFTLRLEGDPKIFSWFGIMIAVSMGMMKRK